MGLWSARFGTGSSSDGRSGRQWRGRPLPAGCLQGRHQRTSDALATAQRAGGGPTRIRSRCMRRSYLEPQEALVLWLLPQSLARERAPGWDLGACPTRPGLRCHRLAPGSVGAPLLAAAKLGPRKAVTESGRGDASPCPVRGRRPELAISRAEHSGYWDTSCAQSIECAHQARFTVPIPNIVMTPLARR
jgi:hypothetical protein